MTIANPKSIRFRADVFARAIHLWMDIRKLSVRKASVEMGVSPATLNRVTRGYAPDIDSYFRMRFWLENQRAAQAPACWTCRDLPDVCVTVPGLRHCEKANRSNG